MGIFTSKTSAPKARASKKPVKAATASDEVLTPESQQVAAKDAVKTAVAKGQAGTSYRLLVSPRISEKAAVSASKNVYVFNVPVSAEKVEIAKAVTALYGVAVEAVRTARGIGKRMVRGKRMGRRNKWKKAYVSVKQGQKIDLYEGV